MVYRLLVFIIIILKKNVCLFHDNEIAALISYSFTLYETVKYWNYPLRYILFDFNVEVLNF